MQIMGKKVLVISSSPRRGGNSDLLCDRFMTGAQEAGHHVEKIFLRDKHVDYCFGCMVCQKTGRCVRKDDMEEILKKMIEADILVFGTPVYFYGMSAQMKTLIDRSTARYLEIRDKEAYIIAAAAEDGETTMDGTVIGFQCYFDCLDNVTIAGHVFAKGVTDVGDVKNTDALETAYRTGKNI